MPSDLSPRYGDAIAGIESGGNYGALGPLTRGDRAFGKYQIMGANIPQWSQEALGQSLTPDQFLADPQAQDAVFQFKFGQYVNKYGPEGAAKAWFAGERGMNNPNAKDALGTSVADYGAKFMKGLGGVPTQAPQMPAFAWSPSIQGLQAGPPAQQAIPQNVVSDQFEAPPPLTVPDLLGIFKGPVRPGLRFSRKA